MEEQMRVLVACEYSGTVRDAFIARGHDAMSCDLLPTDAPGPHYQGDMFDLNLSSFDLVIAHPPCTALCVSGNRYYAGTEARQEAAQFIWRIWTSTASRLAIENPVGVINTLLPDMPRPYYIQPWQFGEDASKKTGLWLRGLPPLLPTQVLAKERYANQTPSGQNKLGPSPDRWKLRSATYPGIADAMAQQWSKE
jgi:hypothetical protein